MKEYVVDVSAAASWADFIAAFNEGFVRPVGGAWNGHLDAFNDFLWWPDEHPYRLVTRGWQACATAVNQHKTCEGLPILESLAEIFRDNPQAEVILAEPIAATEAGWLTCERPVEMLACLHGKVSDRKLRLFAVACCRRATPLLSPEILQALQVAELFAEGQATDRERRAARATAMTANRAIYYSGQAKEAVAKALCRKATEAARFTFAPAGWLAAVWAWTEATQRPAAEAPSYKADGWDKFAGLCDAERLAQCDLIRDIVGNPFGPRPPLNPAWLTWNEGAIGRMALTIYLERAWNLLPILADALEEAGCVEDALIGHCRAAGEHVRGCWAIDLLLRMG